jgi:TonB family protein
MTGGGGVRWFRILQERDRRRIRRNVLLGVYLPILAGIAIVALVTLISPAEPPREDPSELGGMSGGGGGDDQEYEMEFGSTAGSEPEASASEEKSLEVHLLKIKIIVPGEQVAKPTVKPKPKEKQRKKTVAFVPGPPPVRRLRGTGPGTGGGTGGGSGGGIGAGVGFSIDWGGTGSRRLLSGRLPKYPPGTDAEMAIGVTFTVLGDGTVSSVVPTKRGNEILEREAVSALRTWRFEALPEALAGKVQSGSVVFNFKLDKSPTVR